MRTLEASDFQFSVNTQILNSPHLRFTAAPHQKLPLDCPVLPPLGEPPPAREGVNRRFCRSRPALRPVFRGIHTDLHPVQVPLRALPLSVMSDPQPPQRSDVRSFDEKPVTPAPEFGKGLNVSVYLRNPLCIFAPSQLERWKHPFLPECFVLNPICGNPCQSAAFSV
jgi:hypothetical protein